MVTQVTRGTRPMILSCLSIRPAEHARNGHYSRSTGEMPLLSPTPDWSRDSRDEKGVACQTTQVNDHVLSSSFKILNKTVKTNRAPHDVLKDLMISLGIILATGKTTPYEDERPGQICAGRSGRTRRCKGFRFPSILATAI